MPTSVPMPVYLEDIKVEFTILEFHLIPPPRHQLYRAQKLGFADTDAMLTHYASQLKQIFSATLTYIDVLEQADSDQLVVCLRTTKATTLTDEVADAKRWLEAIDIRAPGLLAPITKPSLD